MATKISEFKFLKKKFNPKSKSKFLKQFFFSSPFQFQIPKFFEIQFQI